MIGILSIQGGFAKHQQMVHNLGFDTLHVKTPADLHRVDKLIIPGGESTTMRLLLQKHGLWDELKDFCATNQVFGTCAGAILLSKTIQTDSGGNEESFGVIDITIARNSYGRQVDSFEATLNVKLKASIANGSNNSLKQLEQPTFTTPTLSVPAIFIRAPQIIETGSAVQILATYNNMPVLVQQGSVLAATFHPELTDDNTICNYFLNDM